MNYSGKYTFAMYSDNGDFDVTINTTVIAQVDLPHKYSKLPGDSGGLSELEIIDESGEEITGLIPEKIKADLVSHIEKKVLGW